MAANDKDDEGSSKLALKRVGDALVYALKHPSRRTKGLSFKAPVGKAGSPPISTPRKLCAMPIKGQWSLGHVARLASQIKKIAGELPD